MHRRSFSRVLYYTSVGHDNHAAVGKTYGKAGPERLLLPDVTSSQAPGVGRRQQAQVYLHSPLPFHLQAHLFV